MYSHQRCVDGILGELSDAEYQQLKDAEHFYACLVGLVLAPSGMDDEAISEGRRALGISPTGIYDDKEAADVMARCTRLPRRYAEAWLSEDLRQMGVVGLVEEVLLQ